MEYIRLVRLKVGKNKSWIKRGNDGDSKWQEGKKVGKLYMYIILNIYENTFENRVV